MNNFDERILEALIEWNNKKKEESFIPTVDMLIEEIKEELTRLEARRLTINND